MLIFLACFVDYLIGDPIGWLHPVQVMGFVISWGQQRVIDRDLRPRLCPLKMKLWGVFLGLLVMVGSATIGGLVCFVAERVSPILRDIAIVVLSSSCLAGRSLRRAALSVLNQLTDLPAARKNLSYFVGRDTAELSAGEVLRAVLETVTENGVDGVTAPLFYCLVGHLLFPPFGAVIFGLFYKASSTLDSMIGYKEAPFTDLGWFSAKTEDVLTWLPCRLTVLTLSLLSGRPGYVWRICRRDGSKDASPNSGWSECVYAAILGVQMGGENRYKGKIKVKPLLGENLTPITPQKVLQALDLTRSCCLIWLFIFGLIIQSQRLQPLF